MVISARGNTFGLGRMKILANWHVLLILVTFTGVQLISAKPREMKFTKESVFILIKAPEANRAPTTEEFKTVGNIFVEEWDKQLQSRYDLYPEHEYIRVEAEVDIEKCSFVVDNPELGTYIRVYFKNVALVFTADSVPIAEKQVAFIHWVV